MSFLKRKQIASKTVEVKAEGTSLLIEGSRLSEPFVKLLYNDEENSQNSTIHVQYKPKDGESYFEDYSKRKTITAGELSTITLEGGYSGRIWAVKTSDEDVLIDAFAEQWANYWAVWKSFQTTIEVPTEETVLYFSSEKDNIESIILYYDDAGTLETPNNQDSYLTVWISVDGQKWYKLKDENFAHLALNRRLAILVPNLLGLQVKLTGHKPSGAENVTITVEARRRNLQPR